MLKETKRKTFKFYRSYFDMFNELEKDKDKLAFIEAVFNKQFLGIDPKLNGIVKFAYISQLHSIEKQVKGWQDATGQELTGAYVDPNIYPIEGCTIDPTMQVEVKEEEKEKEEVKDIYREFAHLSITNDDYEKLCVEYEPKTVNRILDNIENYKKNKGYVSLYLTAKNWLTKEPKKKSVELEEKKAKKTWSAFTDIND